MKGFAVLVLIALVPLAGCAGYALHGNPPQPTEVDWIYSPRQTLQTPQEGVIVYCQGKTNSLPFANRKKATPGDVLIQTCRAVQAPPIVKPKVEPPS